MPCPEAEELIRFRSGLPLNSSSGEIAQHLHDCAKCRRLIATLDVGADGQKFVDAHRETSCSDSKSPPAGHERSEAAASSGQAASDLVGAGFEETFISDSEPAPEDEHVGETAIETLGEYRIIREIGRGGMGIVYEAEQVSLGRRVAIKVLPSEALRVEGLQQRFEREARAAARLHHTNIVPVFGFGHADGRHYLVMQMITGVALDDVVRKLRQQPPESTQAVDATRRRTVADEPDSADTLLVSADATPVAEADVADPDDRSVDDLLKASGISGLNRQTARAYWKSVGRMGVQIAEALAYAHGQGVLHRDIKPSNLILDRSGTVWVTDFGLARLDGDHSLTASGDVLGTLRFMPPEAFKGQADVRSEVYSLGLTLYELATLRRAFDQQDRHMLIDRVMNGNAPDITTVRPDIPADLRIIIQKAIEPEADHRYPTAAALADDLRHFVNDEPIQASRTSLLQRLARWSRRNPSLAAALTAVAVLLMILTAGFGLAAWYFQKQSGELNTAVTLLTNKTEELTRSRDQIQTAQNAAEQEAEQNLQLAAAAETARRESVTMLADMQTERGFRLGEDGDAAGAAVWFAHAAQLTPHDSDRASANRLRARNWLQTASKPISFLPTRSNVRRIQFQPNGPLLITVLFDEIADSVRLWNWRLGTSADWPDESPELPLSACDARWSPDGRWLAVVCQDGRIEVRHSATGAMAKTFSVADPVCTVRWSPDGSMFATGGAACQVWKAGDEPALLQEFPHPDTVRSVQFSPRGDQLATGCADGLARVFAIGAQAQASPLTEGVPHEASGEIAPVFLDDGNLLVTGREDFGFEARRMDGTLAFQVPAQGPIPTYIFAMTTSPDGRWVAAAAVNVTCYFQADGKPFWVKHNNQVNDVAFGPDSQTVLTSCWDGASRFWSVPPNEPAPAHLPHFGSEAVCVWSPDGDHVAVGNTRQTIVWERAAYDTVVGEATSWGWNWWKPRVSFDGKLAAPGFWHTGPLDRYAVTQSLTVIQTDSGAPAGPVIDLSGWYGDSCICADNSSVAVLWAGAAASHLSVFDIGTGHPLIDAVALPSRALSVAARPDSKQLAVLCEDGELLIIHFETGQTEARVTEPVTQIDRVTTRVRFTPDASAIVTITSGNVLTVRDVDTLKPRFARRVLTDDQGVCRGLDFSTDSRLMATAVTGTNAVRVWDLQTGLPRGQPLAHPGNRFGLSCIAFHPDGRQIVTGHKDGNLRLWDWQSGTLSGPVMTHADEVNDVVITTDGRIAITAVRNGTVRFWDLNTFRQVAPPANDPLPEGSSTQTLALIDTTLIAGSPRYPVLDVSGVVEPAAESLLPEAELAAARELDRGELAPLSAEHWEQRWQAHAARPARTKTVASYSEKLNQMTAHRSRMQIARQALKTAALPALIERHPDVAELHHILALSQYRNRNFQAGDVSHTQAVSLYEQQRLADPFGSVLAADLADFILMPGVFHPATDPRQTSDFALFRSLVTSKTVSGNAALAAAWLATQHPDKSLAALDAHTTSFADFQQRTVMLLLRAETHRRLDEPDAAERICQQFLDALESDPLDPELYAIAQHVLTSAGVMKVEEVQVLLQRQAIEIQLQYQAQKIQADPKNPALYQERSTMFARIGRWQEAADDTLRWIQHSPEPGTKWLIAAPLLVLADDAAGYAALRNDVLQQAHDATSPLVIERAVKACLLRPDDFEVPDRFATILAAAIADDQFAPAHPYFTASLALLKLRTGDAEQAIALTADVTPPGIAQALSLAVRAMAEAQTNKSDDALRSLELSQTCLPPDLPALSAGTTVGPIAAQSIATDWLIPFVLTNEATTRLQTQLPEKN